MWGASFFYNYDNGHGAKWKLHENTLKVQYHLHMFAGMFSIRQLDCEHKVVVCVLCCQRILFQLGGSVNSVCLYYIMF